MWDVKFYGLRKTTLVTCMLIPLIVTGKLDKFDNGSEIQVRKFPDGLRFGVATAAYQIEGACDVADRAPSIWDEFCKIPDAIKDGTNGNDACNSYYFYERDIEMIKFLGVDYYRFSVSWPRLFPNGFVNYVSEDGKKYYNNLIDGLIANGIEPILTMYHWDLPQKLQDLGGWANPLIVDWFEDYARKLYTLFGDRVKTWITVNEPKQFGIYGYGMTRFAPGLDMAGVADYIAVKHILLAHARAWHVYDKEFREEQKGICGITIATDFREGASNSPEDIEAGLVALDFEIALYTHPIFTEQGGFPERALNRVAERSAEQGYKKSRLQQFSDEEIEYIRGTSDFFGFNHYSTRFYTPYTKGMYPIPSYNDDIGGIGTYLDYPQAVLPHVTSIPEGIRKALNWVKDNCGNPPIMIFENGFGNLGGPVHDDDRIQYYKDYLWSVLNAIDDGVNVVAYTAWSLMDNFEWDSGLSIKFGLFEVDYEQENRTRTARESAFWYKNLVATRTLDLNYVADMTDLKF